MDTDERLHELLVHPDTLALMQDRGGTWAAYQNNALDSANVGHLQFLQIGAGRTYATPPAHYPVDTASGMGWRYVFIGMVDLQTGRITKT